MNPPIAIRPGGERRPYILGHRWGVALLLLISVRLAAAPAFDPAWQGGMVVQRDQPLTVHGTAAPGEEVAVSFGGQALTERAGGDGAWSAVLPSFSAEAQGREMRAKAASGEAVLRDVLVGDIWLCAGQSNMLFMVRQSTEAGAVMAGAEQSAKRPVRLMNWKCPWPSGAEAWDKDNLPAAATWFTPVWSKADAEHLPEFSAIAWHFASALQEREPGVPLGIIDCAVGGSPILAWIPEERLKQDPLGASELAHWLEGEGSENTWCDTRAWQNLANVPNPGTAFHHFKPGALAAAGLARMTGFRVRGVLWYQGESEAEQPWSVPAYRRLLPLLVTSLRERFGPDAAFVCMQLPGIERRLWPEFRAMQAAAVKSIRQSALVTTWDTGDRKDVHPKAKQDVGRRAAVAAMQLLSRELSPAAPEWRGERKDGRDLILEFSSAVSGPTEPAGFEVRAADGNWRPAAARLENGAVRLPGAVDVGAWRYAWSPFPGLEPLRGASGLPVVPCRRGGEPRRVACIGDSITYGLTIENRDRDNYPAQLQGLIGGDWLVGNFGNSGRCVILSSMRGPTPRAWMKQREFARAVAFEPQVVVSNLGINDVMAFDAAVFERDYAQLLAAFAVEGRAPEWRIGTPLGPLFAGHGFYGSPVVAEIDASLRNLAARHGIKTIDLRTPLQDYGEFFADHIHPNAEGATIIAREVAESLGR